MVRPIRPLVLGTALTGAVALGVVALPAPAASAAVRVTTLSTAYRNPVQLAVHGSTVLVANGNGLFRIGTAKAIAFGPRYGDVSGIAFNAAGTAYAYTSSTADHATTRLSIVKAGARTVTADLSGFERRTNPDGHVTYGVLKPSACVRAAFKQLDGGPANYLGKVDSHPYAVAASGTSWYLADAGGNDILRVAADGTVSQVAVLPRQPFTFSARLVAGLGLPSCVVGVRYYAEPVPTDVEVASDGALWVTTLPGLYDLGQLGSLYRIDPRTHVTTRVATGLAGAVNVAITSRGAVYVSELLRGRVSRIRSGKPVAYASLPNVTGLEAVGTTLYAAELAPIVNGIRRGPGKVVRLG